MVFRSLPIASILIGAIPLGLYAASLHAETIAGAEPKQKKPSSKKTVPPVKNVGAPRTCIPIRSIRDTHAHDDFTIDFKMLGGKVYRNSFDRRCPGLKFENAFAYSTSLTQLCRGDIITVISNTGVGVLPRGSCGLNNFQQVELIEEAEDEDS